MEEQLVQEIASIAAMTAIDAYHKNKEKEERKEKNRRLSNTKKLMAAYPELKEYVKKVDHTVKETVLPRITVDSAENIIDLINFGDDVVKSIKASTQATLAMIQHLDKALETLEYIHRLENNMMAYNMLKKRYIEKLSIEQVMELYNMGKSNVYKILDRILERLSVLLFGIYGVKVV